MITAHQGDCLDILKTLDENSIDAIVTDPPYGISFMSKKWDYDVPSTEIWAECLRVLKPGGHLLAFAGTRTQHRMAIRIEDAGFDIRDLIAWVHSQGFPKNLNIGKALDEAGDPAASDWQGWGTALKPSLEPITVARKPFAGTVSANVLAHGVGGLNIDGCRIELPEGDALHDGVTHTGKALDTGDNEGSWGFKAVDREPGLGRYPPNVIHDGSDEVYFLFPEKSGGGDKRGAGKGKRPGGFGDVGHDKGSAAPNARVYDDAGSAARFFYCAKATKADREGSKHPTVKPLKLMRYLCRLVTPVGGTVLDPFAGSGSTGHAAHLEGFNAVLIEREAEYFADIQRRIAKLSSI